MIKTYKNTVQLRTSPIFEVAFNYFVVINYRYSLIDYSGKRASTVNFLKRNTFEDKKNNSLQNCFSSSETPSFNFTYVTLRPCFLELLTNFKRMSGIHFRYC